MMYNAAGFGQTSDSLSADSVTHSKGGSKTSNRRAHAGWKAKFSWMQ